MNGIVGSRDAAVAAELGIAEGHTGDAPARSTRSRRPSAPARSTPRDGSVIVGTTSVLVTHIDRAPRRPRRGHPRRAEPVGREVLRDGRERCRRAGVGVGDAAVRLRRRLRRGVGRRRDVDPRRRRRAVPAVAARLDRPATQRRCPRRLRRPLAAPRSPSPRPRRAWRVSRSTWRGCVPAFEIVRRP